MKLLKFIILFFALSSFVTFGQSKRYNHFHPFSGKVVFSGEFGFTHSYTDFIYPRPQLLSRGTIEFFLPVKSTNALGLKVTTGLGSLNSVGRNDYEKFNNPNFNTNLFFLGTGITYASKLGYSIPYLSATISHLRINPKDKTGNLLPNNLNRKYDLSLTMYTAELGIRFLVREFWSVNFGVNYNITNSDYLDDLKIDEQNDKFLSIFFGLSFYYGGTNSTDSDNDGISNSKDFCPDTPLGTVVDEFGCTKKVDDIESVFYEDDTTQKVEVVENQKKKTSTELPIKEKNNDSDMDGVPDYLDKCPNTLANVKVNSDGCKIIAIPQKEIIEKIEIKKPKEKVDTKKTIPIKQDTSINKKAKFKKINISYQYLNEQALPRLFFTDGNLYCFQVGAFRKKGSAEKLRAKLIEAGHQSFIVKSKQIKNRIWFRVRVGYFNSLRSAKNYKLDSRDFK